MSPRPLHIGVLADTHFWLGTPVPAGNQLQLYSERIGEALVADLADSALDLVVHLGDVTCGGSHYGMSASDFDCTLDWFLERIRTLSCPVRILPGNHDLKPGETYRPTEIRLGLRPGLGTSMTFPEHRLHFELLNAQGHTAQAIAQAAAGAPVAGWVAPAELDRLAQALDGARDWHVILGTHQLLQPMSDTRATDEGSYTRNRQEVRALLAAHTNVRTVLQGHAHRYDVHTAPLGHRDCTFVVAPALCLWPPAWLHLTVGLTGMDIRIRHLHLDDLPAAVVPSRQTPEVPAVSVSF